MKRFALLFAVLLLSSMVIGCGEEAIPPAGKMGTGPDNGPSTKGLAAKDHENLLKAPEKGTAKGPK